MTQRQPHWAGAAAMLAMLSMVALHLWLAQSVPLRYNAAAAMDEALAVQQARSIVAGQWLGPYTTMTLARGCGFPVWLALVHLLGLPLNAAASIGWSLACAVLYVALQPALPQCGPRLALFAALLFTPEALGDYNLLRELIYPSLVLAMAASGIGLALRAWTWRRPTWHWAVALGLSSAAFVVTREEWVLGLPLWTAVALVLVLQHLVPARRGGPWVAAALRSGACLLAAAGAGALPLLAAAALNQRHYGAFTLVELNSRPFSAAMGALTRVRHAGTLPQVPVPHENWTRIAAVSPAFAELRPRLEGEGVAGGVHWFGPSAKSVGRLLEADAAARRWLAGQLDVEIPPMPTGTGASELRRRYADEPAFRSALDAFMGSERAAAAFLSAEMEQEIGGHLFVWILREAAAAAGHHRDAASAQRYYERLAHEVNGACSQGRLDCRGPRVGLDPPLTRWHRQAWPGAMAMASWALISSENHTTVTTTASLGELEGIAAAERFLHRPLAKSGTAYGPAQPWEALIVAWRYVLPPLTLAALLAWLLQAPVAWRSRPATLGDDGSVDAAALWWIAALALAWVLLRMAVISLVHVTSWPAAITVRYLAPAQPLLVLFVGLGLTLGVLRWRQQRALQ